MSSFGLKIIALLSMFCDHFGYIFFHKLTFLNIIGKIAFPIFAFQISEGYIHTKNLEKYFYRLLIFAIISQIPFMLFLSNISNNYLLLNIFFTLLLGLSAITIYDKSSNKIIGIFLAICIAGISELLKCDYGWFGVTVIFLFYMFKNNKLWMNISIIISILIKYVISFIQYPSSINMYLAIATILSLIFINLYNGKKGKNTKYLLYIFYPLHLMVLYIISFYLK